MVFHLLTSLRIRFFFTESNNFNDLHFKLLGSSLGDKYYWWRWPVESDSNYARQEVQVWNSRWSWGLYKMNLTYFCWCIDLSWVNTGLWAKKLTFPPAANELPLFPFESVDSAVGCHWCISLPFSKEYMRRKRGSTLYFPHLLVTDSTVHIFLILTVKLCRASWLRILWRLYHSCQHDKIICI